MEYLKLLFWFNLGKAKIIFVLFLSFLVVVFEGFSVGLLIPMILNMSGEESNVFSTINILIPVNDYLRSHGIEISSKQFFIVIILLIILRQFFSFCKDFYTELFEAQGLENIRIEILSIIFHSSLKIFVKKKHGEFTNMVFQATSVSSTMINASVRILFNYLLIILYFILMLVVSYKITILIILIAFLFQLGMRSLNKVSQQIGSKLKKFNQNIFNQIIEFTKNIKYIKLTSSETLVVDLVGQEFKNLKNNTKSHAFLRSAVNSLSPLILVITFSTIILFSFSMLKSNIASLGLLGAMLYRLQQSITQINSDRVSFTNSMPSYEYLKDFLLSKQIDFSQKNTGKKFIFRNKIEFKNVDFKYNKDNRNLVLDDINFKIKKNIVTGIIGPSGSGKTTIIELLINNYKIDRGTILIDDYPIDSYNLKSFKNSIGYVSQENIIFNESIRYNLLFGTKINIMDKEIWKVLDFVSLRKEIEKLPDKLDYKLGDSGYKFSGGQRQRLCLARALIAKPKILILDEPTSSLDNKTEKIIKNNILFLKKKMTIIIISHSEQVIDLCDKIYSIENGTLKLLLNRLEKNL